MTQPCPSRIQAVLSLTAVSAPAGKAHLLILWIGKYPGTLEGLPRAGNLLGGQIKRPINSSAGTCLWGHLTGPFQETPGPFSAGHS